MSDCRSSKTPSIEGSFNLICVMLKNIRDDSHDSHEIFLRRHMMYVLADVYFFINYTY